MPRAARKSSESNVYHVMARGVGRQLIFEDDGDRRAYLAILREELGSSDGHLLAWCLMDNHVHLLVQMSLGELSERMRVTHSTYALLFNKRHDRVGHLFQGRFKSEPVEDERQLLTVLRYIHQNPVKAGMSQTCDYPWSSYRAYLGLGDKSGMTECELVLDMFGSEGAFVMFHRDLEEGDHLDVSERPAPKSEGAIRATAAQALGPVRIEEVSALPRRERNEAIRTLRSANLSVRQIERLTGVSRGVVARI